MGYKAYSDYKESGVEWFGQCPAHWQRHRLKWTIESLKNGVWGSEPSGEDDLYCIRVADFDRTQLRTSPDNLTLRSVEKKDRSGRLLNNGDLLLEKSGGGDKQLVGVVVEYTLNASAVCSNFVASMTGASNIYSRYLAYLHAHLYSSKVNYRSIKQSTGIQNLDAQMYFDEPVVYPKHGEQQKIANFLDYKTAQIDQLIEKKQELIEKLQEQRTTVITQVVTRGLNSNSSLKFTGSLGNIPIHWKEHAIKFGLSIPITDGPHETPEILSEGVPFLSAEAVKDDTLDFEKKRGFISLENHNRYSKKYKPSLGDIYMVKSGATTGNIARVETTEEFNIWSPLAALRPNKKVVTSDFIFYFMKSAPFNRSVELGWNYGTQQNIGMGVISNLRIAVPPIPEQESITVYLKIKTNQIDGMLIKINEAIARLQEYRTALITAAVTGQIDVRDWQAPAAVEAPKPDMEVA